MLYATLLVLHTCR